jgi:hypothetical protein
MGGGERDVRDVLGLRGQRLARRNHAAGAVGIEQIAALAPHPPDAVGDGGPIDTLGDEGLAVGHHRLAEADRPALAQPVHLGPHEGGVAPGGLEQEALEVGGDLDVHGGGGGRNHVRQRVHAGAPRAVQDVVLVGGDRQPLRRQAHALGGIAREHVAEVAGRHREGHRPARAAERRRGDEIVGQLGDDAAPVDGVDGRQLHAVAEGQIVEHGLHQRLAVVEGAVDGDGVHVRLRRRRHHAPLHVGDAPLREQHDGIDALRAAERLDGRAAGVSGRRRHDGDACAAGGEDAVHQARQQLHGHVLEGQGRPVEQLEHPQAAIDLHERRHGGVAEAGVGLAGDRDQLVVGDRAARERLQQRDGHFGERPAGEGRNGLGRQAGPRLRQVEPAVARKTRQQRVLEGQLRRFASGAHVPQETWTFVLEERVGSHPRTRAGA